MSDRNPERGLIFCHYRWLRMLKFSSNELLILDLKSFYCGYLYPQEVLKYFTKIADSILLSSIFSNGYNLGSIHLISSPDSIL